MKKEDKDQEMTVLGEDLNDAKVETPDEETPPTDVKEYLSELVGEGKKYKTEEDLAKAYSNADNFIETLKSEKRELEAKMEKSKTIEDVLKAINTPESTPEPGISPEPTPIEPAAVPEPASEEDISDKIERVLAHKEKIKTELDNVDSAWADLDKAYGGRAKAKIAVREFINGDENVKKALDLLGKTNPTKLVEIVTATKKSSVSFIDNNENSQSLNEGVLIGDSNTITWDQVKQIKEKDPKLYNSKAFKQMLHKADAEGRLKY